MKKIIITVVAAQFLGAILALPIVNAQTAVSGYGYAAPSGVATSGPAVIVSPPMPIVPPVDSGFVQFNNLTVESVSASNPPAEILASNPNIYTVMGTTNGTAIPSTPSVMAAPSVSCLKFDTQSSASGRAISCPTPPSSTTTTLQFATGTATGGTSASPMIYPPYPFRYQPYRIEIDASTQLILRDRTVATLASFSSGDQINVFGYYNTDGSIQAYLVRDLSKPAQDEFLQLNNVELISVSTNTTPTTLVVAQIQNYPCYGFGINGTTKQSIACPMGISAATNGSALQNLSVPAALMPSWQSLKKYVIVMDAQTILLDSNRTKLSLTDLQVGDQMNIYGNTTDNGQTLHADIVRDLSLPATPTTYSGTIKQVNTDGSFVIQTGDGQTITVPNPIQIGSTVQLTGLLDRLTNLLSQISNIYLNGSQSTLPPVPANAPMLRIQGGASLPPTPAGTPNTKN